jgi:transposase-like protein
MGDIEAAIAAIESLSLGEKFSYTEIARQYNVDRTTLSRRHRKVTRTTTEKYEEHRLLNTTQEAELIQYLNKLCAKGLPLSREMIRNFASEIARKPIGKN